ncbi:MAG: GIY-YIG nuclease family protein [Selenomonadales bacterium]|nr:GIY-YIG nuclease family protein [Selenomonadales bacterium]
MTAYVYMLSCADGSLYTGWTNDLAKRLENHQAGKGAKYTRGRLPVTLAYYETYETESEARKRECAIKKLTRQQKEKLIQRKPEQIAD